MSVALPNAATVNYAWTRLDARWLSLLHVVLAIATLSMGAAASAFAVQRAFISEDGVSYLDIADAFVAGDWSSGINGYWSPLYPLLIAGALRLTYPTPSSELLVLQSVNFVVFLLAFAAFVSFWRQLDRERSSRPEHGSHAISLSSVHWWLLGYLLFAWSTLRLIKVWTTTPDMAVLAAVLAAGTLLLMIRRQAAAWLTWGLFGLCLGLGYLAKAAMFPMAFVFFAAAASVTGAVRTAVPRVALSVTVFLLVTSPVIVPLSVRSGTFSFGETGRLNYARYVNGIPDIHWRGEIAGSGTPAHPTRQLRSAPSVYEFATPVRGTYPVWYDPAYWYEGLVTQVDVGRQVAAVVRAGAAYADLFLLHQGAALAIVILLLAVQYRFDVGKGVWRPLAVLWCPALAGFALYSLVYVEPRYVAPFLILGWGAVLAVVRLPAIPLAQNVMNAAAILLAVTLLVNLLIPNDKSIQWAFATEATRVAGAGMHVGSTGAEAKLPAARALTELGVRPGDSVAVIGNSFQAYWARLARVRVVAEVPESDSALFWQASASEQEDVIASLFSTGARAVVAAGNPRYPPSARWQRLGGTGYYAIVP